MEQLDKYIEKYFDEAKDLAQSAKEQTASITQSAKEIIKNATKDARAGKELKDGIARLEALPEVEGSIIYKMELEAAVTYLRSLVLFVNDERLDDDSVAKEIRKVMDKVQPAAEPVTDATEEEQAIENVRAIAYSACAKSLQELTVSAE